MDPKRGSAYSNVKSGKSSRQSSPSSSPKLGRTDWIAPTPSPGPHAYTPDSSVVKSSHGRTVFGTARRDQEERRYISSLHNDGMPIPDTPGPGTYRVQDAKNHPHNPLGAPTQTFKFGTAAQRPDVPKEFLSKPGPVYTLPSSLGGKGTSFAPGGSMQLGVKMSRESEARRFISPEHSYADRTVQNSYIPGPSAYALPPADRTGAAPAYSFSRTDRDVKSAYTQEMLRADPGATTFAETPGAVYDLPCLPLEPGVRFGREPQRFSPEWGGNQGGPFISKQHALTLRGTDTPGPGTYDNHKVGATKPGSGVGVRFGSPGKEPSQKTRGGQVPGPGAHTPKFESLSRVPTASSYSLAPRYFGPGPGPESPGPAAYSPSASAPSTSLSHAPPSYTMGATGPSGRQSFVAPSHTPAPNTYSPALPDEAGRGASRPRGFSFGGKDKTVAETSVVSLRYLGPLAAQEGLGTQSPGPLYDVRGSCATGVASPPRTKFGTSSRAADAKIFHSNAQAVSDMAGVGSPGPGAYDVSTLDLSASTSRFQQRSAPRFGTSSRFNDKSSTF